MQLEMVPALDQLVVFGRSAERQQQQPFQPSGFTPAAAPLRVKTTHFLPSFVKLVATQEAKLEGMKRAEKRKVRESRAGAVHPCVCVCVWVGLASRTDARQNNTQAEILRAKAKHRQQQQQQQHQHQQGGPGSMPPPPSPSPASANKRASPSPSSAAAAGGKKPKLGAFGGATTHV